MTFEKLIGEHDHLEELTLRLEAICERDVADVYGVAAARFDLKTALDEHLAHEQESIYAHYMESAGAPNAVIAQFHARFEKLCADWNDYLLDWNAQCLEADWPGFKAETADLMRRVRQRTSEETQLIYAMALQHGVLTLRHDNPASPADDPMLDRPGYTVREDLPRGVIRMMVDGFFDLETLSDHFTDNEIVVKRWRSADRPIRVFIDAVGLKPHTPEGQACVQEATARIYEKGDKVAVRVSSSLVKMQMRRALAEDDIIAFFVSEAAALTWLEAA
ncbi:hemerythrin domain-containing protein [Sphingomonas sp. BIUV-7]|uniref:Hemerythrin domain-containing protein n=1 Tax=Sphingomonas natans TaxID=3063330 RepID=A0ABT8YFZ6_9SPHN|nr:hemerythrin domain-containing protein [Sphingomonas sp. BIUV-7]MDO6416700.1 hemerythrin domain-containing protein [Sphingomonas sp. BIUV-7]